MLLSSPRHASYNPAVTPGVLYNFHRFKVHEPRGGGGGCESGLFSIFQTYPKHLEITFNDLKCKRCCDLNID